jgi:hypothetical protein
MRIDDALMSQAVVATSVGSPLAFEGFRLLSVYRTKSMAASAHNRLLAAPKP